MEDGRCACVGPCVAEWLCTSRPVANLDVAVVSYQVSKLERPLRPQRRQAIGRRLDGGEVQVTHSSLKRMAIFKVRVGL